MLTLILVLTAIVMAIHLRMIALDSDKRAPPENVDESNGVTMNQKAWGTVVEYIGMPLAQYSVNVIYAVYMRCTLINVSIFLLKYIPTGYYMYKFVKDVYLKSRERIKQKQIEMEDIQLQIQIVNTKLCVRDAEFTERAEQLRRGAERLRQVRAHVRRVIAADDELRRALRDVATDQAGDEPTQISPDEDHKFIVELLKELKFDHLVMPEVPPEEMGSGECAGSEHNSASMAEPSERSALSDAERPDCRVKIVKVTNVYKVAYLKHYVKQKRLRRAMKQALLKKKMENIKNLLEDWQKTLNTVINSKLTILNIDHHPIDVASQDAMGDYSKPRGSSDTDSDLRNSWSDVCYDEYNQNWSQNPYKSYGYNYEDGPESAISREFHDSQDNGDGSYPSPPLYCECGKTPNMMSIIEETNSQLAFAETKSEVEDDYECRDLIVL